MQLPIFVFVFVFSFCKVTISDSEDLYPRFSGREGIIPLNYKAQCNFLIISVKFLFYFDKLIGTFIEFTRLHGVTLYYSLIKKQ